VEKDFDSRPSIVMESTGHYHKILFHLLYKFGFEVSIINPSKFILSKILE